MEEKMFTPEPRSDFFNADCTTFMKDIPDGYFSLAVCDPPYGINIASNPFRQKFAKQSWDNAVPDKRFFDELFRVSKNQIIWGGNYFALPPNKHFLIWDKCQPFDFSSAMCEYAWSSLDTPAKLFRYRVTEDKGKIHPTQKPVELYAWILKNYAKDGDIIFDPMAGSGSSRIAAFRARLDYVGLEICREYHEKAVERFEMACRGVVHLSGGRTATQLELF